VIFALSIAIGQLLFKVAANSVAGASGNFVSSVAGNLYVWSAFAWYGLSSFLWIYILIRVPLSKAYPFALIGSAIVPLLSWLAFGEKISPSYVIGGLIVLTGLYIIFAEPIPAG
jgi:drug/metabolite transporter (DMT)-like permease